MRRLAIKKLENTLPNRHDFFGIAGLSRKDISGSNNGETPSQTAFLEKYEPLMKARWRRINEERFVRYNFGKIRFDPDNTPLEHGQYEVHNTKLLYESSDIKQMFQSDDVSIDETSSDLVVPSDDSDYNRIQPIESLESIFKKFQISDVTDYINQPPLTFNLNSKLDKGIREESEDPAKTVLVESNQISSESDCVDRIELHELRCVTENKKDVDCIVPPTIQKEEVRKKAIDYLKEFRSNNLERKSSNAENPISDMSSLKLDSKGFFTYEKQVPDWRSMRRVDIVDFLCNNIVYNNYDIVALNKPYGLITQDELMKDDILVLTSLMKDVARNLKIERLRPVHRLDKTTTGVLLFAASKDTADKLNKLFKSEQVIKKYWCITRGVPEIDNAIIDIPITEFEVAGKKRSCVAPERLSREYQISPSYRFAKRAITEYKVIKAENCAALLEVMPKSGLKHQIRCHLGFGLGQPILGDHKYSHFGSLAPQQLPAPILKALNLRQSKSRTLPIHLHAKKIVIPGIKNGQNLHISAPLPHHFVHNMKLLKLDKL